ncbi:hypothetical protein ASD65_01860 [Microbacterium sp. Root61]|nr:hypothetical protein ASD65_01860 [Microbacterium sp. Root61]
MVVVSLLLAPVHEDGWCAVATSSGMSVCQITQWSLVGLRTSLWIWLGALVVVVAITILVLIRRGRGPRPADGVDLGPK